MSHSQNDSMYSPLEDGGTGESTWRGQDEGSSPLVTSSFVQHVAPVDALLQRYKGLYKPPMESVYSYCVGVANTHSGELAIAKMVQEGMLDELGRDRVITLKPEIFADPQPIRTLIKKQAVVYHAPNDRTTRHRGTLLVSGGDGTISFLMTQLDAARRELVDEFQQALAPREGGLGVAVASPLTVETRPPSEFFTMPALAPLPLGTGNDYSNCIGFGSGFQPPGPSCFSCLWEAWCDEWCGGDNGVQGLIHDAIAAPCVPFDRWEVTVVPLREAQTAAKSSASGTRPASCREGPSSAGSSRTEAPPTPQGELATVEAVESMRPEEPDSKPLPAAVLQNSSSLTADHIRSPLWERNAREVNFANAVYHINWASVRQRGACPTHGLINYLGVGYDAYVTCKFDATRRQHPGICSTRVQNKAVYGVMGVKGALKCKPLRKLVPMICVPDPMGPLPARRGSQFDYHLGSPSEQRREMVALELPTSTKALVLTNVSTYSAGTQPWKATQGRMHYKPVVMRGGAVVPTPAAEKALAKGEHLPGPTPDPVTINDGRFEVQAMGGILHYGTLGLGVASSEKMVQTDEMFVFVLCTPEDLYYPPGSYSAFTEKELLGKYGGMLTSDPSVRASLNVQIDGEAMPRITEPTVLHVHKEEGVRVSIRCRNPRVIQS